MFQIKRDKLILLLQCTLRCLHATERNVHRAVTVSLLTHGDTDSICLCVISPEGAYMCSKGKAGGCFHWSWGHLHCCKHVLPFDLLHDRHESMHENPISQQWECEQDVAVFLWRCIFAAVTSLLYNECISYCIHIPFCAELLYFWNLSWMRFQPGSNTAHDFIILCVFLCCYMLVYQSRGKKRKKDSAHHALHDACGTGLSY